MASCQYSPYLLQQLNGAIKAKSADNSDVQENKWNKNVLQEQKPHPLQTRKYWKFVELKGWTKTVSFKDAKKAPLSLEELQSGGHFQ